MNSLRRAAIVVTDPLFRPGHRPPFGGAVTRTAAAFATANGQRGRSMESAEEDEILVERVADGDKAAYRQLMDRHLKRCIGLARRMTGNAADAEDVAQDAFLRLWRHADRWQPGRGKFSTWLYKIVVNLCIDRSRRRSFLPLEAAGDPADDRPDAAEGIAKAQTAKTIAAAIARLPERQRAALTLRYYEDIGNAEAAEILAVSVDAIESLLLRARRSLRAELAALAPSNAKEET